MPRLTFVSGGAAREVVLQTNVLVIGSDASCKLVIAGSDVSPVHCELRQAADGGWRVVDLESRAGTRVNGEYVNQRALRDGDVIDVGGHELRFDATDVAPVPGAAPAPAPARAPAAPPAAAPRPVPVPAAVPPSAIPVARPIAAAAPARGAAPVAASRRKVVDLPDEEEAPDREGRRLRRRTQTATTTMFVVAGVLGIPLVLWALSAIVFSETDNHAIRARMASAERALQWQRVIDLAAEARDDGSHDWGEIRKAVARAQDALAGQRVGDQVEEALRDWSAVLYWRQSENGKDDAEYAQRIREFLVKHADLDSDAVRKAKQELVKLTGTSTVGLAPTGADAAWKVLSDDVAALEGDGRFGAAIAKVDAWWTANGREAPQRRAQVDAERARLTDAAEKWFAKQVAAARWKHDLGEKRKAQKILEEAASKIGLPGYEDRAMEELRGLAK